MMSEGFRLNLLQYSYCATVEVCYNSSCRTPNKGFLLGVRPPPARAGGRVSFARQEAQLLSKLSAKNPTEQKFSGVLKFAFDCEFTLTDRFKPR